METPVAPLAVASTTPFCINCEWMASSTGGWTQYKCRAQQNVQDSTLNLVNGEKEIRYKANLCHEARGNPVFCGVEGKWYKERSFTIPPFKPEPIGPAKKSSVADFL